MRLADSRTIKLPTSGRPTMTADVRIHNHTSFKKMIWSDLTQLASAILLILGAVLPVVNPLGDAPIFLRMTPGCDEATRALLATRIAFYSFFFVLGSLLFGSFVLLVFGISIPVVQVAGGAVVCALAWKVLADIPKPADVRPDPSQAKLIALGRAITPLTLPMTIDAGVIAVAITVGAFHANSFKHTVIQLLAAVIGAAVIAFCILLTYRYAHRVSGKIGRTGMMVLVRLSAFIMLCIGVGISWDGIKSLLAEIGIHS
jgi:multiple antibiotic resistance protein